METTYETKEMQLDCEQCKKPFTSICFVINGRTGAPIVRLCPECQEHKRAEKEKLEHERRMQKRLETFEALCRPIYRSSDLNLLSMPDEVKATVISWQYGPKGLMLYGPTGAGKTRLMWMLVRRLVVDEGRQVAVESCQEFGLRASDAAANGQSIPFIKQLSEAEVLFFDDFGKFKLTERVEEALFAVIEGRYANQLPVLITTNYTGKTFAERFSPTIGQPILRRLNDMCTTINAAQKEN